MSLAATQVVSIGDATGTVRWFATTGGAAEEKSGEEERRGGREGGRGKRAEKRSRKKTRMQGLVSNQHTAHESV